MGGKKKPSNHTFFSVLVSEYHLYPPRIQPLAHSSLDRTALLFTALTPIKALGRLHISLHSRALCHTYPSVSLTELQLPLGTITSPIALPMESSLILWVICHGTRRQCLNSPKSLLLLPNHLLQTPMQRSHLIIPPSALSCCYPLLSCRVPLCVYLWA